jgi:hypothetical protein
MKSKKKKKNNKTIQNISNREINELKKNIFDEAVNVRLDYEQNPNEDTGSLIIIHQNSEFLKEK